jgi:hypothetical protein
MAMHVYTHCPDIWILLILEGVSFDTKGLLIDRQGGCMDNCKKDTLKQPSPKTIGKEN